MDHVFSIHSVNLSFDIYVYSILIFNVIVDMLGFVCHLIFCVCSYMFLNFIFFFLLFYGLFEPFCFRISLGFIVFLFFVFLKHITLCIILGGYCGSLSSAFRWLFLFILTRGSPPPFIFISCRLITLQYCSGFCHTLT